ncbi:MAG: hypothetical protein KGP27_02785 [Hyphomicrobiales bacterium]|nr:hypothetical protein [Hyphomicrobiales bacterium]
MKCAVVASVLRAHAEWLRSLGLSNRSDAIAALAGAISAHPDETFLKILKGAEGKLTAAAYATSVASPSTDFASSVGDLKAVARFCDAIQPKVSTQLVQLAEMLERTKPTRSVFIGAVSHALVRAAKPADAVDNVRARQLADELTAATKSPERFAELLQFIAADKTIGKATVNEIANQFLGLRLTRPSKAAAIKKIEERHRLDLLNDSRGRTIQRVAV